MRILTIVRIGPLGGVTAEEPVRIPPGSANSDGTSDIVGIFVKLHLVTDAPPRTAVPHSDRRAAR